MSFGYQGYTNPYARQYGVPSYAQPQYAPQPQQMPPQQMAQPQQPMQYETPIQNVGYATLKEAEAFIVYPNSKALFIDKQKGMSYLKTANNEGLSTIRYFKQVEVNADGTPIEPIKDEPKVDLDNFVKKDELGNFVKVESYNELLEEVKTLKRQLASVSQPIKPQGVRVAPPTQPQINRE